MAAPPGAAALVVGIDGYALQPLTSAENDARAFRDALVRLELVDAKNIELVTGPAASKRGLLDSLYNYYAKRPEVTRWFFFYAGHGCLGYADPAHSRTRTALLPIDFEDFDTEADLLVDVDEVAERMRTAGPQEQFFFIDACRDIPYDAVPNMSPIPWKAMPIGAARAQAMLYAVSPLGKAVGTKGGMGVMTTHLIDALDAKGCALDYDPENDEYVVTAESVCAYAQQKVKQTLSPVALWQQKYMLPEPRSTGPRTGAIRTIATVQPVELTVHIDPDTAAAATQVKLLQRKVVAQTWPPNANHVPVKVEPQRYRIEAGSTAGAVDPSRAPIDVREQSQATIRVSTGGPAPLPTAAAAGPSPATTDFAAASPQVMRGFAPEPQESVITAVARETQVSIEVEGLQPPYFKQSGRGTLTVSVPAGSYRVSFRLGTDVFSATEVATAPRETVTVRPTVAESALLREALGPEALTDAAVISESVGQIQSGVLPTMLSMIGLKVFDTRQELFGRFAGTVPTIDPAAFGPSPLAVVIAIDGEGWPTPPGEMLGALRFDGLDGRAAVPVHVQRLAGPGFDRILLAVGPAPRRSFYVKITSPHFGSVLIATAALERRASVVTVRLTPEGRLDVSQNLLRIPGLKYEDEPDPWIPPGQMIRELQLGQKLYQSGELFGTQLELIQALFYAKWTDPILSCMAYFALIDAAQTRSEAKDLLGSFVNEVTTNLMRFFGGLPDSRIVRGLAFDAERGALFDQMLRAGELPVLARSAVALAAYAEKLGAAVRSDVSEFARRIPVGSPWSLQWEVPVAADAMAATAVRVGV